MKMALELGLESFKAEYSEYGPWEVYRVITINTGISTYMP